MMALFMCHVRADNRGGEKIRNPLIKVVTVMPLMDNTGLNANRNSVHRSSEAAEVILFLLHDLSVCHTTRRACVLLYTRAPNEGTSSLASSNVCTT